MGRRGKRFNSIGCLAVLAGIIIILALILPPGFWWFALAVGLICVGVWLVRCR